MVKLGAILSSLFPISESGCVGSDQSIARAKLREEYLKAKETQEQEAQDLAIIREYYAEWITQEAQIVIIPENLCSELADGVILCSLLSHLYPDIQEYEEFPVTGKDRQKNFKIFEETASLIGLPAESILTQRNLKENDLVPVARTLYSIEKLLDKKRKSDAESRLEKVSSRDQSENSRADFELSRKNGKNIDTTYTKQKATSYDVVYDSESEDYDELQSDQSFDNSYESSEEEDYELLDDEEIIVERKLYGNANVPINTKETGSKLSNKHSHLGGIKSVKNKRDEKRLISNDIIERNGDNESDSFIEETKDEDNSPDEEEKTDTNSVCMIESGLDAGDDHLESSNQFSIQSSLIETSEVIEEAKSQKDMHEMNLDDKMRPEGLTDVSTIQKQVLGNQEMFRLLDEIFGNKNEQIMEQEFALSEEQKSCTSNAIYQDGFATSKKELDEITSTGSQGDKTTSGTFKQRPGAVNNQSSKLQDAYFAIAQQIQQRYSKSSNESETGLDGERKLLQSRIGQEKSKDPFSSQANEPKKNINPSIPSIGDQRVISGGKIAKDKTRYPVKRETSIESHVSAQSVKAINEKYEYRDSLAENTSKRVKSEDLEAIEEPLSKDVDVERMSKLKAEKIENTEVESEVMESTKGLQDPANASEEPEEEPTVEKQNQKPRNDKRYRKKEAYAVDNRSPRDTKGPSNTIKNKEKLAADESPLLFGIIGLIFICVALWMVLIVLEAAQILDFGLAESMGLIEKRRVPAKRIMSFIRKFILRI